MSGACKCGHADIFHAADQGFCRYCEDCNSYRDDPDAAEREVTE